MEDKNIITLNERSYELKFNEKTIETVERLTGSPLMASVAKNNGILSLSELRTYFSNALYTLEGGRVSPQQASDVYDKVLNEKGYPFVNMLIVGTIQRDCPFFFQAD